MLRVLWSSGGSHVSLFLVAAVLFGTLTAAAAEQSPFRAPAFCYAPGTSQNVVDATREKALWTASTSPFSPDMGQKFEYTDGDRWRYTATDGHGLGQGDPITLTWSIVPDGTPISPAFGGESSGGSTLRSYLNGVYPSESAWIAEIQQVFDRWGALTGITYVYVADDGAPLPSSSGQLGVRGDVRISGHSIDGDWGVLAYNYFPNTGDMVIDVPDAFFSNTSNDSIRLRNVVAHEHGHGLGFEHSCPVNQTKLMEPYVSMAFDGPQHDDILAANRAYGDRFEHDDSAATAADLGAVTATNVTNLSIDDSGDIDYFSFAASANQKVSLTVSPVGFTYLSGPQNSNGSCSAGSSSDSLHIHDLELRLLDVNGTSELAAADDHGVGVAEELNDVALSSGAGNYFVEVSGDATSLAQLYQLTLTVSDLEQQEPPGPILFDDGFETGDCGNWIEVTE